jgi:adenosylhomocysteine nucleosidase
MKIGIIGAEKQEVDLLIAALALSGASAGVTKRGTLEFHEGFLHGRSVVVVCCGIGKVNAAMCAQTLISEFSASAIVNTGSAGGLDAGLSVLDMVVCTDAVQHDFDTTIFGYPFGQVPGTASPFFAADPALRALAHSAFSRVAAGADGHEGFNGKMIEGRIASGDAFVNDVKVRDLIVSRFSPACVEMEGAAIAQVCAANGVPFIILRSVSDLAGKDAGMSYDEFSHIASKRSARVVMEMMSELEEIK